LLREIPFNAIQFVLYDLVKHSAAAVAAVAAVAEAAAAHSTGATAAAASATAAAAASGSYSAGYLVYDALLGAAAAGAASLATQPLDTAKTRIMTKSVPTAEGQKVGVLGALLAVAKEEGVSAL
jgi:Mitochondrial carrier protein